MNRRKALISLLVSPLAAAAAYLLPKRKSAEIGHFYDVRFVEPSMEVLDPKIQYDASRDEFTLTWANPDSSTFSCVSVLLGTPKKLIYTMKYFSTSGSGVVQTISFPGPLIRQFSNPYVAGSYGPFEFRCSDISGNTRFHPLHPERLYLTPSGAPTSFVLTKAYRAEIVNGLITKIDPI